MTTSGVPAIVRQGELVEQLAREILASMSQPFAALVYNATRFAGYAESELLITKLDGTVEREFPPRSLSPLNRELRQVMHTETAGAWYSMTLAITNAGSATAHFNFTEPPPLDGDLSPFVYVDDLAKFPRPDAAIPDRFRAQLERAAQT
jgi:hypothetical protein